MEETEPQRERREQLEEWKRQKALKKACSSKPSPACSSQRRSNESSASFASRKPSSQPRGIVGEKAKAADTVTREATCLLEQAAAAMVASTPQNASPEEKAAWAETSSILDQLEPTPREQKSRTFGGGARAATRKVPEPGGLGAARRRGSPSRTPVNNTSIVSEESKGEPVVKKAQVWRSVPGTTKEASGTV